MQIDDIDISSPVSFKKFHKDFIWEDKEDKEHKLSDIDDRYLDNLVHFLERRVIEIPPVDYDPGTDSLSSNEVIIEQHEILIDLLKREQIWRSNHVH